MQEVIETLSRESRHSLQHNNQNNGGKGVNRDTVVLHPNRLYSLTVLLHNKNNIGPIRKSASTFISLCVFDVNVIFKKYERMLFFCITDNTLQILCTVVYE